MAQCRQTPKEFIRNAFTPQIAVLCTDLVETFCQKNKLSFIELLQPFSKLSNDVHFKDPLGAIITIRNLKLTFLDVNAKPPDPTLARKFMNLSVSEVADLRVESFVTSERTLNITLTTPWFEAWRDTFLKVQYPSEHEYTKHFLSCVLVVSSAEINVGESVTRLAQSLNQMQNIAAGKLPKWFCSNILKYYVIVHDNVEGNIDIANEAYESIKSSYGEANCFLLRMNSRPPGAVNTEHLPDPWSQFINNNLESKDFKPTPENSPYTSRAIFDTIQEGEMKINVNYHPLSPDTEDLIVNNPSINEEDKIVINNLKLKTHGLCLSTEDIEQVKLFLHEFTKTCLLPYIEKQIHQLSDVISNKKGVSRSLFSATKRWFNPNKPGASSVSVNHLIYAPDSPELQVRRLGDLYFMFGHYSLAFQAYHSAKRDYNIDQAWLYYAGALEMAALSAFMANESSRKTFDYMEESITTYLNTCKMPQFATRATLLSSECLKSRGLYGEAAHQLIRMTSEESELRSALFLEQAAYCFLHSKMVRKYAFHMVLAGHRFSKAAQRKHSLRSYKQAHQIYKNSGWDLAEDHIYYTIGRQAHNLHSFDEAVISFARLLNGDSKQSGQQQSVFLKEYLTILGNKLLKENDQNIPILALPELDKSLKILMEPALPLSTPGKVPAMGVDFVDNDNAKSVARWNKLEELLVQEAFGLIPLTFKPMISLYTINDLITRTPTAIVNEPVQVCIHLINTLQIVLQMKDIYLLWSFKNNDVEVFNEKNSDNVENYVKTHIIKSVSIQSNCNQNIILLLTPLVTGVITLKGICYTLCSSNMPMDNIFIKGKQLFNISKMQGKIDMKNVNKREIEIKVVPLAPCLQVTFSELNLEFLCDEVQKVTINFQNTGTLPLHKVYMATSSPELLCNSESKHDQEFSDLLSSNISSQTKEKIGRENHITFVPLPNNKLEPGQSTTASIFIKAPNNPGFSLIDLLIYYENIHVGLVPRYRLVRHKWNLSVQESVKVELLAQSSFNTREVEEIALVLKISNLNKVHSATLTEISVLNVGMLSKYWRFTENIVSSKYINLHSQESAYILLKACRIREMQNIYSNIRLDHEQSFRHQLSPAYVDFARKTEHRQLNLFKEIEQHSDENIDGIVFVQWQAFINDPRKRIVDGQTQINLKVHKTIEDSADFNEFATFSDAATLLEVSLGKEDHSGDQTQTKVTCSLIYPAIVEHNFERDKFCVVPVTLLLHNIASVENLNVIVNALEAASGSSLLSHSDLFYPYASKNFRWLGTGSAVIKVKALSTEPVTLSAVVSRPGTYNLGDRIEIFCSSLDNLEDPVLQICEVQSTLIVVDGEL